MNGCDHDPFERRTLLINAGFDGFDLALLQVTRYFFAAFSDPEKCHWTTAFSLSKRAWGPVHGPALASGWVEVLDAMRITRREIFRFSNPVCPKCSAKISNHERHLMGCFCGARHGDKTQLNASAIMLFNGQEPRVFINALNAFIGGFGLNVLNYHGLEVHKAGPKTLG